MSPGSTPGFVYLDYNATAPLRPEAREAVLKALEAPGNPSSVHRFGRAARKLVEEARASVAALVGAEPKRVVFTSGGTEANNLALRLAIEQAGVKSLIVSAIEHDSVLRPARHAGLPIVELPAGADGVVLLAALEEALAHAPKPALVALMLANNETGAIQPVAEVTRLAHEQGALLLCDAVQAAGKIAVDLSRLACDFLTLSAHKLGGPTGVGALVTRDDWVPAPLLRGGGQEQGQRAGTENLPGIAGFGAAAAAALQSLPRMAEVAGLRDRLQAALLVACPEAPVHGGGGPRLPNTLCIGMPGVPAETQVMALDLAGVAVSAGSACSSGKVTPSHVLTGMGLPEPTAREAIRFSLGWATSEADIERAARVWSEFWMKKRTDL
ncbi:cysteine desulfurase family protein [uncultured Ferrovibrio sp.]|jgi:cysteine desulfurase|uniref:cysteine desulfurase family protein n=1 Tax=uncultured Ferrovibrio sp. TaxID=1576913 RepID=UPI00260E7CE0|nr:cysteine desulfurase family protein [uncultured Ferrovibrio sp.]